MFSQVRIFASATSMTHSYHTDVAAREPIGFVTCVATAVGTYGTGGLSKEPFPPVQQLRGGLMRLRRLGNTLPVAAFHVDHELTLQEIEVLSDPRIAPVRVVDVTHVATAGDRHLVLGDLRFFRSFYCKNFAMLHSPFAATMLIDCDALFFADPVRWWRLESVRRTGTLFFEDIRSVQARPREGFAHFCRHNRIQVGANLCEEISEFARRRNYSLRANFSHDYAPQCQRQWTHLLDSTLIMLNTTHVGVQALLRVMRKLLGEIAGEKARFNRTQCADYSVKEQGPLVSEWGLGDKELLWQASELAGYRPFFARRGGPLALDSKGGKHDSPSGSRGLCWWMHLEPREAIGFDPTAPKDRLSFVDESTNARHHAAHSDCSSTSPAPGKGLHCDETELSHANMANVCYWPCFFAQGSDFNSTASLWRERPVKRAVRYDRFVRPLRPAEVQIFADFVRDVKLNGSTAHVNMPHSSASRCA